MPLIAYSQSLSALSDTITYPIFSTDIQGKKIVTITADQQREITRRMVERDQYKQLYYQGVEYQRIVELNLNTAKSALGTCIELKDTLVQMYNNTSLMYKSCQEASTIDANQLAYQVKQTKKFKRRSLWLGGTLVVTVPLAIILIILK
jgi:uncharacterized membrane protein